MKKQSTLLCFLSIIFYSLLTTNLISAQTGDCVTFTDFTNGSFENTSGCTSTNSSCFTGAFNDCVLEWFSANGSPDLCWTFPVTPVSPAQGSYFASIGALQTSDNECYNEALFTNIDFDLSKIYELTFQHQKSHIGQLPSGIKIEIYLTHGFSNVVSSGLDLCSNLQIPSGSELLFSETNFTASSWISETISIQPQAGLDQLLFVAYAEGGENTSQFWLLDDLSIEECIPCPPPVLPQPDYFFVDAHGNPQTEFCPDEEVYIDASNSIYGRTWFLAIWQYNIGGYAAGGPLLNWCQKQPTWSYGQPGLVNLNDIWEACYGSGTFTPEREYRIQLAFSDDCGGWYVKDDGLFVVIDDPKPEYTITDSEGNPRTMFCFGEEVYLDGEASMYEDRYFLSIWKYNIGGYLAGESHLGYSRLVPEWAQGEVGFIHLNPVWANFGEDYFEPGFEYRIQLALRNDCNGWVAKDDGLFTVECCDELETCDADYSLDSSDDPANNIITYTANNLQTSSSVWSESHWYLYQHDDFGSGPYTPVAIGEGDSFEFEAGIGECYSLVHKVITPCGECCVVKERCNNEEGGLLPPSDTTSIIDCDSVEYDFCPVMAPTNLNCTVYELTGDVLLSWDPVPAALSYVVNITINDPDCCESAQAPQVITNIVNDNSFTLSLASIECFSWQVIPICPSEQHSTPSIKICSYKGCGSAYFTSDPPETTIGKEGTIMNEQLQVYPNPTTGLLNFEVRSFDAPQDVAIHIYNINHQLVGNVTNFNIEGHLISGTWEHSDDIDNGLYIIEIITNQKIISEKFLVIK